MKRILVVLFLGALLVSVTVYYYSGRNSHPQSAPLVSPSVPEGQPRTAVVAENLHIPWEVAFLPDGEILVTERPGTLFLVKENRRLTVRGVNPLGEGGLLGLVLHPDFASNHWLYLYLTGNTSTGPVNRVERYRFDGQELSERKIIIEGIMAAANHDGGRFAFGPDGYLYITTGDAGNPTSAQDTNSLNGKILRVTDEGAIPPDNPFGNAGYSYGHRNPEGLAWDNQGNLWATEHGRSGAESGLDELNLIEKGKNYGWPIIQGEATKEGVVSPVIQSGPDVTWAPAGAAFYEGSIFFGGLRGETLFEYQIANQSLATHFQNQFGRIRAVVLGPDGDLYLTTSNTDGRGTPQEGDDKLIRVNPKDFR